MKIRHQRLLVCHNTRDFHGLQLAAVREWKSLCDNYVSDDDDDDGDVVALHLHYLNFA